MATGLLESMDYKGGGLLERTHCNTQYQSNIIPIQCVKEMKIILRILIQIYLVSRCQTLYLPLPGEGSGGLSRVNSFSHPKINGGI